MRWKKLEAVERFSAPLPGIVIRFSRWYYNRRKVKFFQLEKSIKSARMPIHPHALLGMAVFYGIIIAFIFSLFIYLIIPPVEFSLSFFAERSPVYLGLGIKWPHFNLKFLAIPLFFIVWGLIYYMVLSIPSFIVSFRRSNIDTNLPHVVNMLLAASKGGLPIIEMIKTVAEETDITQECGREFGEVVKRVTIFNEDLISAMRYVAGTTPSVRFSNFLEDFISVIESGGKIEEFLRLRSKYFLEEKERFERAFLDTLEAFAEVYLAVFVVAPLFLIITLVVMGMMGESIRKLLNIVVYIFVPLGSIMFILLMGSIISSKGKWVSKKITEVSFLFANIIPDKEPEFRLPSKLKYYAGKLKLGLEKLMRERSIYVVQPYYVLIFTIPISLILVYGMRNTSSLESMAVYFMSINIIPYSIFYEIRTARLRKVESLMPDFLRQMASLNEAGMSAIEAIRVLSSANLGVLTKEIIKIRRDVEWGKLVTDAFKKFEQRIGSALISKVISMLVKALETSYNIKGALTISADSAYLEVESWKRLRREMLIYVMLVYISYGVFLFTVVVMVNNFLGVLAGVESSNIPEGALSLPDLDYLNRIFFHTALIGGFFSGLVAGLMGEGDVRSGLKHSAILLLITLAVFKIFIGG